MVKKPKVEDIDRYFVVNEGTEEKPEEVIYSPPLLAKLDKIRIELRQEKNHGAPHVHIIKKGSGKTCEISVDLKTLKPFDVTNGDIMSENEYKVILKFIQEHQGDLVKLYKILRSRL